MYNGFHPQDVALTLVGLLLWGTWIGVTWKSLGPGWRIPGMIYAAVMIFMVIRAASLFFGTAFSSTQAILLTAGTALLTIADFEYSIHRFVKPRPWIYGPLMYPTGQLLIALSPAYFLVS